MLFQGSKHTKYRRIEELDNTQGVANKDSMHADQYSKKTSSWSTRAIYITLSFLSGFCFAAIIFSNFTILRGPGSYETGFATEIESLRPAIELVKTQFTGTLRYKDKDHLYINLGRNGVQYFGLPSAEVDNAWDELIGDHEGAFPGDILGPDVLHSLHCVNEIRKVLDSQQYYNRTLESLNRGRRIHIDHCLNHIRQVIQCHMDLTPVRTIYFEDVNAEVGDFDQVHMCRDFGKLREWMNEKHVASGHSGQKITDGRVHRLGYPDNKEALLGWDERGREFD